MPGPAPKPEGQRRRRNAVPGTVVLPAAGRSGPIPAWPLDGSTAAELALWSEVWVSPQAFAWEALGMERVVARYVRVVIGAEARDAAGALLGECRQLEDRLGLSPMALLRLRWVIGGEADVAPELAVSGAVVKVDPGRWSKDRAG